MLKISYVSVARALRLSPLLLLVLASGCVRFHHHASRKTLEPLGPAFAKDVAYEKSQCSLIEERVLESNDRFKILREPIITSGRKLRMYSARQILFRFFIIVLRGKRGAMSRDQLDFWYEGKRETRPA